MANARAQNALARSKLMRGVWSAPMGLDHGSPAQTITIKIINGKRSCPKRSRTQRVDAWGVARSDGADHGSPPLQSKQLMAFARAQNALARIKLMRGVWSEPMERTTGLCLSHDPQTVVRSDGTDHGFLGKHKTDHGCTISHDGATVVRFAFS